MGKYNMSTIFELLEKTFKLSEPRTTPVLEGKARMCGPLNDISADTDFKSLKVCENCRNHLAVDHMQNCSFCGDGYHSVCLERPQNADVDKVICYKCQGELLSKDMKEKAYCEQAQGERVLGFSKETQRSQGNEQWDVLKDSIKGTDVSKIAHDTRSIFFDGGPTSPINQHARTAGVRRKIKVDFDNTSSSEQSVAMDVDSPQNTAINEETVEVGGSSERKPATVEVFISAAEGKASTGNLNVHQQGKDHEVLQACGSGYQNRLENTCDKNLGDDNLLTQTSPSSIDRPNETDSVKKQMYQINVLNEEGPENRSINPVHKDISILPSLLEASNSKDYLAEVRQVAASPVASSPKIGSVEKIGRRFSVEVGVVDEKFLADQVISRAHDVGYDPDQQVGLVRDEALMAAGVCSPSLDAIAKGVDKNSTPSPSVKDKRKVFPISSDMLPASCIEVSKGQLDSFATVTANQDSKEDILRKSSLPDGTEAERPTLGLEASSSAPLARRGSSVDDVRPCELCGDIGYEDMLAVCNDCNAALHVYCAQNLLSSVPEGYWQCDICKLNQKVDKSKHSETRPVKSALLRLPSLNNNTRKQSNVGNTRSRLSAVLQKKRLASDKRRVMKGALLSQPPAKRFAADGLADAPRLKKQAIENTGLLAIHPVPKNLTRDGSFKLADTGKTKFVSPKSVTGASVAGEGTGQFGSTGKVSLTAAISPANPLRPSSAQVLTSKKGRLGGSLNAYKAGGHAQPGDQPGSTPSLTAPIGLKNSGSFKFGDTVPPFLVHSKSNITSRLSLSNRCGKEGVVDAGTQVSPKDGAPSANAQMATIRIAMKTSSPKPLKAARPNIVDRRSQPGNCMGPLTLSGLKTEDEGHSMKGVHIKDDVGQGELAQTILFSDTNDLHPMTSSVGANNSLKSLKSESSSTPLSKDMFAKVLPGPNKVDDGKNLKSEISSTFLVKNKPSKVEPGSGKVDSGSGYAEGSKYSQNDNGQEEKMAMLQPSSSKSTPVKVPESVKADVSMIISDENFTASSSPVVSAPMAKDSYSTHKEARRHLQDVSSAETPMLDVLDSYKCAFSVSRATKNDENWSNLTSNSRLPLVWTTSNFVPSLGSTRCYRCKEVGHAAKSCNNRAITACISPESVSAFKSATPFVDSGASAKVKSNATETATLRKPSEAFVDNGASAKLKLTTTEVGTIGKPCEAFAVKGASAKLKQTTTEIATVGKLPEVGKDTTLKTTKALPNRVDDICKMSPLSPTRSTHSGVLPAKEHQEAMLGGPPITRDAAVSAGEFCVTTNSHMSPRHQEAVKACPEQQIVWKGSFEVSGDRNSICYHGLQANLSNRALTKVREVAIKLESGLPLEELPRSSEHNTWPLAFQKSPPINENIALYFFADNKESHTQSYLLLLDRLIKHDLALKGYIDDAELLIFPSNLLPLGSQCWNNSMFLWAVFRDRKPTSKQAVQNLPTSAANQPKILLGPEPFQPVTSSSMKPEECMQDTMKSKKLDVLESSKMEGSRLPFPSAPLKDATSNSLINSTALAAKHHSYGLAFQSNSPTSDAIKLKVASPPVIDLLLEVKAQQSGKPSLTDVGAIQVLHKPIQQNITFSKASEEGITRWEPAVTDAVKSVNTSMVQSSSDKSKHLPSYRPSNLTVITPSSLPERHTEALVSGKLPDSSSRSPADFSDRERGTRDRIHENCLDLDRADLERKPYRERDRDRDREWPRDWARRQERERDWVQQSRPWDWQRGRERDRERGRENDRARDRERERERERERGQLRERIGERKRGRDRENEKDWKGRDWDRERQRERGRERVKERELEKDVSLGRDYGRFRHREHADTEVDREGRYLYQNPPSGSPSTGPRDPSHSWSRLDRQHRSFRHHSRSCSHSLESAPGADELQQKRAESRDQSQDSFLHQGEVPAIEESTTNRVIRGSKVEDRGTPSRKESNTDSLCGEKTRSSKDRLKAIGDLNMIPVEIDGNEDDAGHPQMPMKGLLRSVREQGESSISKKNNFEHPEPLTFSPFDGEIERRSFSPLRKVADLAHSSRKTLLEPSELCLGFSWPSSSFPPCEGGGPGVPDLNLSLGSNTGHLPQRRELPLFMPPLETHDSSANVDVSLGSVESAGLSLTLAIPQLEQNLGVESGKSAAEESVSTSLRLFG